MTEAKHRPTEAAKAPPAFRDALTDLVQFGLRVARMVAQIADAETALAEAAAQAGAAEGVSPLATSLAEAIDADRAAAAAAEARQTVVARAEAVAGAFARVSRSVRLTILLAERLDRGWARGAAADDRHAMAGRQIARGAAGREAAGEPALSPNGMLVERLEALDREGGISDRAAADIIGKIGRTLGLDAAHMTSRPPCPDATRAAAAAEPAPSADGGETWQAPPPHRRPDG